MLMEYTGTQMQKELILHRLKNKGFRITKQRLVLLDIILSGDCSCCKEIYYRAVEQDPGIGVSTVYRLVNSLEEIGAISRSDIYKIKCESDEERKSEDYTVMFEDGTCCSFSEKTFNAIVLAGLKAGGYAKEQRIEKVSLSSQSSAS
jgi:Fur family transcriptional regulator, ferric uptake regulator